MLGAGVLAGAADAGDPAAEAEGGDEVDPSPEVVVDVAP
jgi:hypothetical protein